VKLTASNVLAFLVGLAALIGAIVLTAVHTAVPTYLWAIAIAGITAGAGLSIPGGQAPALTLTEVAETLPKLLANYPVAVKVEDVAKEVLHQLLNAGAVATPPPAATPPAPVAVADVVAAPPAPAAWPSTAAPAVN
jgi:hypothetical protein